MNHILSEMKIKSQYKSININKKSIHLLKFKLKKDF